MWRVFEAIGDFLRPRSVRSRLLEVALDLQRLDQAWQSPAARPIVNTV